MSLWIQRKKLVTTYFVPTYTQNRALMREHSFTLRLPIRANLVDADLERNAFNTQQSKDTVKRVHYYPNFQLRDSPPVVKKRGRRSNPEGGQRPRCLCPGLQQWCSSPCQRTTSRSTTTLKIFEVDGGRQDMYQGVLTRREANGAKLLHDHSHHGRPAIPLERDLLETSVPNAPGHCTGTPKTRRPSDGNTSRACR